MVGSAAARPTLVAGDMAALADGAPSVGAGYTVIDNRFHPTPCLAGIATTPSYNFDLVLSTLTPDAVTRWSRKLGRAALSASDLLRGGPALERVEGKGPPRYRHRLLVVMSVERYDNPVDEPHSTLTTAAAALAATDPLGFFDTCGTTFVRSMNRSSALLSVFTYESDSETPDKSVEMMVRGFSLRGAPGPTITSQILSIEMYGIGGAPAWRSRTTTDVTVFRAALKEFFGTVQDNPGIVTSFETVPWVEHAEALTLLLRAAPAKPATGRTLFGNAEFVAETRGRIRDLTGDGTCAAPALPGLTGGLDRCIAALTAAGLATKIARQVPACERLSTDLHAAYGACYP